MRPTSGKHLMWSQQAYQSTFTECHLAQLTPAITASCPAAITANYCRTGCIRPMSGAPPNLSHVQSASLMGGARNQLQVHDWESPNVCQSDRPMPQMRGPPDTDRCRAGRTLFEYQDRPLSLRLMRREVRGGRSRGRDV